MAWKNTLTDAGAELMALAFGSTLNYTRVKLGAGSVSETDLAEQADVTDYIKDFDIVGLSAAGPVSTVNVRVNNGGILQNVYLSQIGVFANVNGGPDVLLMIYQTDTPSVIPTLEEQAGWLFEAQLDIAVSNIAKFTAVINWNAYSTLQDLSNHTGQGVASEEGIHGIRYSANALEFLINGVWEDVLPAMGEMALDALMDLFKTAASGDRALIGYDPSTNTLLSYPVRILELREEAAYLAAAILGVSYLGDEGVPQES